MPAALSLWIRDFVIGTPVLSRTSATAASIVTSGVLSLSIVSSPYEVRRNMTIACGYFTDNKYRLSVVFRHREGASYDA